MRSPGHRGVVSSGRSNGTTTNSGFNQEDSNWTMDDICVLLTNVVCQISKWLL